MRAFRGMHHMPGSERLGSGLRERGIAGSLGGEDVAGADFRIERLGKCRRCDDLSEQPRWSEVSSRYFSCD
jgi:hypothetical protein